MIRRNRGIDMRHRTVALCLGLGTLLAGAVTALPRGLADALPAPVTDEDFPPVDLDEARLGQLLFYDPVLSGNGEVACATCHHPAFGTSDGLSLGLGDGGSGLGTARVTDAANMPTERIPRNAQSLFNVGALEYVAMFHDGRIEVDANRATGFRTPLEDEMVAGFDTLLAAQTMFPVLSADEMAGHYSENPISRAVRQGVLTGEGGAWDLISRRVSDIPEYAAAFAAVYPEIATPEDIGFTDISNALGAFITHEWRSDTAPFDAVLRGEADLTGAALAGAELFYGVAGCASCHAGAFLTDHDYHATGVPQIGPGKAPAFEGTHRDEGRYRVTGDPADLYAFRTPSLRNVALTAPYGHDGAYADLAAFVAAHGQGAAALEAYEITEAVLPALEVDDLVIQGNAEERAAIAAAAVTWPALAPDEVAAIVAFLDTLTDPVVAQGRLGIPAAVPSGLPIPTPAP